MLSRLPALIREQLWTPEPPYRILIVDDRPLLREGIAAVLDKETDMVVAEAGNGREAVEQFCAHRPDVTLMDLQMPVMNGTDAILTIRKDYSEARIIVLTTYSGDAQAVRALNSLLALRPARARRP